MTETLLKLGNAWHYRLDKLIASSTFGEVWQATWLQTGSQVAVKTINRSRMKAASPGLRALWPDSLRHEIELLRQIDDRHLVRMLHYGEANGQPVLILEQLHASLADRLDGGAALPLAEALEITRQVAAGLDWLHRHDLCHLDLKPHNLLFTPPGPPQRLKLVDFGMARALRSQPGAQQIPGSLGWLAPEQVFPACYESDGRPCFQNDARTDVHALGLLLYHLLTGAKTAFAADIERRLRHDPQAIRHTRPEHLPHAGLGDLDRQRLCAALRGERITAPAPSPAPDDGTWLPNLSPSSGSAQTDTRENTPLPKAQRQTVLDAPQLVALLENLLAPTPDARPANAGAVLPALAAQPVKDKR